MIGSEEEVTKAVEGKAILVDDYFMELTQIILHNLTLSELKDHVRSVLSGMFNLSVYEHIVATITLMTDYKLHTIRQPW